jgi:hypothetical protein
MKGKTIRITEAQEVEILALAKSMDCKSGEVVRLAISRGLPLLRIEGGNAKEMNPISDILRISGALAELATKTEIAANPAA